MTDVLWGVYRAAHSYTHVNYPIQDIRNITDATLAYRLINSNRLFQNGYPIPTTGSILHFADTRLAHPLF